MPQSNADPTPPHRTAKRPRLRWALAAAFLISLTLFFTLGGPQYVTLDALKANRDALQRFTDAHYVAALAIAFCVYVAAVSMSLPLGLPMALAIGFLFGRWVGTALVVVAATTGATILFLTARYLFADWARRRMGELGRRINAGFTADALLYMLFLRVVPLFPGFLVNLAPAMTDIRARTFALGTLIGIIPLSFVWANFGQALGNIGSVSELLAPEMVAAFLLLGFALLTPIFWRPFASRKNENPGAVRRP